MFRRFDRPEIKSAALECVEDGPFRDAWNKAADPSRKVGSPIKVNKKGEKKKL